MFSRSKKIMIKILILGSSGILGKYLYKKLKSNNKINLFHTGIKKRKLDATNKKQLETLINNTKPNLIINTIGLTNVDECENNSKISKQINFGIIDNIFKFKKKNNLNFNLIHVSTDHLYDGENTIKNKETSRIYTVNNYSKHKRMAEIVCLKNDALIFRTNFFGKSVSKNISFSDWVVIAFKSQKKIYLFDDVYFNPLRIDTIVKVLTKIIKKKQYTIKGIYNLGSRDGISKKKFAILFAKKLKIFNNKYEDININNLLKVKRPLNMLMNVKKFEKKFDMKLPLIKLEIKREIKNYL
tara:strand:+ start:1182 stop:2075 length:894 start_codon:yes stop_codon:yes gene_type:complete